MRALICAVVLMSFSSHAAYVDGNQLKAWHDEKIRYDNGNRAETNYYSIGQDFGYVTGVTDSFDGIFFCTGPNVTKGQLLDIVGKYLKENPEKRADPANKLIVEALSKAFPCKE